MGLISGIRGWLDEKQAPKRAHEQRMRRAAGVSSVQLICHRDTWQILDSFWNGTMLTRVPKDRVTTRGDMVEVTLSGVHLTGLLWVVQNRPVTFVDRAIADRTYAQIAKVIDAVDSQAKPGRSIPPIVLDDKLGDSANSAS